LSNSFVWWGIILYIIASVFIAYLSRSGKEASMSGYFLGNRKMNGFVSALSYSATTYSAFMMVGLAGLTYRGGVGALGFEVIYFAGVTLVAFFGPRFWLVGNKYGYVTPVEMLGDRYSDKMVSVVIAISSCIFLIPYSAVQLAGVGYLVEGMTNGGISFTTGVVIATVLAIAFSFIAGIRSVMWTDSLQALMMILASTAVVLIVIQGLGGFSSFFGTLEQNYPEKLTVPGNGFWSFATFLSMTVPWLFFSLSNPQVSQRLFMPSSMKSLRGMLLGFLGFGLIYTIVSVLWGFSAVIIFPDLENPDVATPYLLSSELVPTVLGVLVMVAIIAAAISTIDSIMLTLASLFARDVYGNLRKGADERRQLTVGKIIMPIIAVMAFAFAELQLDLIAVLSVASSAGLTVTVPAIIGAFFWKKGTAPGVIASVTVAGILVMVLELTGIKPYQLGSGVWGLLVSTVIFVVVSIFTKAPEEKASEFIDYINEELKQELKLKKVK